MIKNITDLPEPYRTSAQMRVVKICQEVDKLMTIVDEFEAQGIDIKTKSGYVVSIQRKRQPSGGQ